VAEEYPGVTVVTIDEVGKHFALNEGDRLAQDVFPRLYCDADVHIDASSVNALVQALTTSRVAVAGPRVEYGVDQSSWGIKMYCRALKSPILSEWLDVHLVGRGLYATSREARKRFDVFPPLFADDKFFDSQFRGDEKHTVSGCHVVLWVPATLRRLIRSEARVAQGNREYASFLESRHPHFESRHFVLRNVQRVRTLRIWAKKLRPRDMIPIATYLYVTILAYLRLDVSKARRQQVEWS
jgi:hypothetical protein